MGMRHGMDLRTPRHQISELSIILCQYNKIPFDNRLILSILTTKITRDNETYSKVLNSVLLKSGFIIHRKIQSGTKMVQLA